MPVFKFQTKLVDGKPNISFNSENNQIKKKKFDYKSKVVKHPIRSQMNKLSQSDNKKIVKLDNKNDDKHESLFNLLSEKDQKKKSSKPNEIFEKKKELEPDEVLDEIMKQVVLENKDLLTETQLVDLLAKLYLDAHQINKNGKSYEPRSNFDKRYEPEENHLERNMKTETSKEIRTQIKDYQIDNIETIDLNNSQIKSVIPLSISEKKRLKWEEDRREQEKLGSFNPWGRPGCGAPSQTPTNFAPITFDRSVNFDQKKTIYNEPNVNLIRDKEHEAFEKSREQKRIEWLKELDQQVADKEKQKYSFKSDPDSTDSLNINIGSHTMSSEVAFERGKGLAALNEITQDEVLKKRMKQVEQQEAIKLQILEKENQKRLERERKQKLDQEEDQRLNREKNNMDYNYRTETNRAKEKEDESARKFEMMKAQLEVAEKAALMEKKLKRLQKLESCGHDTSRLWSEIDSIVPTKRIAPRDDNFDAEKDYFESHNNYNPIHTPIIRHPPPITENQGVQTEDYRIGNLSQMDTRRKVEDNQIDATDHYDFYERKKELKNKRQIPVPIHQEKATKKNSKKLVSIERRKPWGVKILDKKYVPQSKRDPFYNETKEIKENKKQERVNKILSLVHANLDRIPHEVNGEAKASERHKYCDDRVHSMLDNPDEETRREHQHHDTYELNRDNKENQLKNFTYEMDRAKQISQRKFIAQTPTYDNDYLRNYDGDHEIIRTTDILDPAYADEHLPFSRENTGREKARHGYVKSMDPAHYGRIDDRSKTQQHDINQMDAYYKNQSHPTNRQNMILQQLSDIRQGLLLKQREIETNLSMSED